MAQTGYTPIYLYYSGTATHIPLAVNLGNGELAINAADGNLFYKNTSNAVITVPLLQSGTSSNGWLSSTDWNTFNNKQPAGTYVTSVSGTAPVVSSGGTTPAISMAAATGSVNGYLTSTDWTTFNSKQAALVSGTNIKTVNGASLLGSGDVGTIAVAYGGTGASTASITSFNNITGYTASGATGTTSTNLVFSTSPTLTTPKATTTIGVGNATAAASGAGITFPATASLSSDVNTLDDYEEGTWTPEFFAYGGGAATPTFTGFSATGTYTKIGRVVFATANIYWTARSGGGGALAVQGYPFTVDYETGFMGSMFLNYNYLAGIGLPYNTYYQNLLSPRFYTAGQYRTKFGCVNSSNTTSDVICTDVINGTSYLQWSVVYITDQ